jgi:quinol monooxygenase YgiN
MYGSVFRMRPKSGMREQLRDVMMSNTRRPKGMVAAYLLNEDASEDAWVLAVFEDEQSYRDNANDPAQDADYRRFRELLEADPEWHDGSIDSFGTG